MVLEFWLGKNPEQILKYKQKFIEKVTEVEEVSQLGCVGSGNKLQWQQRGPPSLGERKAMEMHLGEGEEGSGRPALQRACLSK